MDFQGKRILITGGNGFFGNFIIKKALARGILQGQIIAPSSQQYDLRDIQNCETVMKDVNIVIHAAALTGRIDLHLNEPGRVLYDNLMMGVNLMEAARRAGVEKFVSIGSVTEYPADAAVPFREEDIWSGYPEVSHAPYSLSKRMMIVQGQAYRQQYGFNAIHLMPTNLYGPGGKIQSGYVIPSLIQRIHTAKKEHSTEIEIWGTGTATREFIYAEDAAEAIFLATERYNKPDPVNLGSGSEIAINDLVKLICELMDYQGKIRFDTSRPVGHMRRALDTTKAKEEFGFVAGTSLREGLQKTIAWHQEQYA